VAAVVVHMLTHDGLLRIEGALQLLHLRTQKVGLRHLRA